MRCFTLLLMLLPVATSAATFTVDTTADSAINLCTAAANDCSLRGAINASNGVPGFDTIAFNIPMSDAGCTPASSICRITLGSVLDLINLSNVLIDGYTQPGAQANTVPAESGGLNSILKIEIVRSAIGSHSAFNTNSSDFTFILRGVAISGFGGVSAIGYVGSSAIFQLEGNYLGTDANGSAVPVRNGIAVALSNGSHRIGGLLPAQRNLISNNETGIIGLSNGLVIQGNLIGTNRAGTQALANVVGVLGQGGTLTVGGSAPAARNVISGNTRGVITGGSLTSALLQGNFIGTDVSGSSPLGNSIIGVELGGSAVVIGGTLPAQANVIAFNGTQGVATRGSRGSVLGNQMFGNGQLGIGNPGDNGSTAGRRPNDPGDADAPTNNGQNFPEISAFSFSAGLVNLSYRVDSTTANSAYPLRVEFFKADGDEGRTFLFADSYLSTEAQLLKNLSNQPLPSGVSLSADDVIVATATDALGNTSEFSFQPLTMVIETPLLSACNSSERLFCDGFESRPRSIEVTLRASGTLFKPNGVVRLSDSRGASCLLSLASSVSALTSDGRCVLSNSGAPGAITITAEHITFSGAFGSASGGNATQVANLVIPTN